MPDVPPGCKLVLRPEDDYNHIPDDVPNYNESMYFSVFDADARTGGWYRLGNRVNEGYAEIADLLVPRDWSEAEQQRTLDALLGLLALRRRQTRAGSPA